MENPIIPVQNEIVLFMLFIEVHIQALNHHASFDMSDITNIIHVGEHVNIYLLPF